MYIGNLCNEDFTLIKYINYCFSKVVVKITSFSFQVPIEMSKVNSWLIIKNKCIIIFKNCMFL